MKDNRSSDVWRLFAALGDPHRIAMAQRLSENGPQSIVRLIEGMPFSRQAGAKHVGVLESAGVVSLSRQGREQMVTLRRDNLRLSHMFMEHLAQEWDDRLARLQDQLK